MATLNPRQHTLGFTGIMAPPSQSRAEADTVSVEPTAEGITKHKNLVGCFF
jgi:hypothetical protein